MTLLIVGHLFGFQVLHWSFFITIHFLCHWRQCLLSWCCGLSWNVPVHVWVWPYIVLCSLRLTINVQVTVQWRELEVGLRSGLKVWSCSGLYITHARYDAYAHIECQILDVESLSCKYYLIWPSHLVGGGRQTSSTPGSSQLPFASVTQAPSCGSTFKPLNSDFNWELRLMRQWRKPRKQLMAKKTLK